MWNYLLFNPEKRELTCITAHQTKSLITPSAEAYLDGQCQLSGSSLEERLRLAEGILSKRNKLPVLTSLDPFTLYFSWKHPDPSFSCWINRSRISSIMDHFSRALITFLDGQQLEVENSGRLCSLLCRLDVLVQVLAPSCLF